MSGESDRRRQRSLRREIERRGHRDQDELEVVEQRRQVVDLGEPELATHAVQRLGARRRTAAAPLGRARGRAPCRADRERALSPIPNGGTPEAGSG